MYSTEGNTMAHLPTSPLSSSVSVRAHSHRIQVDEDRVYRVAAAVAMVERGHPTGGRVSVRKAARMFGLPKSTVHRYILANRGIDSPRRRSSSTKRGRIAPPKKCGIPFLLSKDEPVFSNS